MTENAKMDQPHLLPAVVQRTPAGMPLCSPGLAPLLSNANANEGGAAVREIARTKGLLAEARQLLPALEAAMSPLDDAGIITVLVDESAVFRIGARGGDDAEWAARWAPYLRALDGMPEVCLREAFVAWHRCEMYPAEKDKGRHAFYPQPAELFALAVKVRNALGMMRHRCRKALERVEERPPPVRERMSRAEMIAAGIMDEAGNMLGFGAIAAAAARPIPTLRDNTAAARAAGLPINREHAAAPAELLGDEDEAV